MTTPVTGGNGQLGQALQQLLPDGRFTDLPDLDITDVTAVEAFGRLLRRWCLMRPASHMPEADMMMAPPRIVLIAFDSSTASTMRKRGSLNSSSALSSTSSNIEAYLR